MTCRRQRRCCGCKDAMTCKRRVAVRGGKDVFGSTPAVPRHYDADTRQSSACHCEERSDVAIRNPAEKLCKLAILRANS